MINSKHSLHPRWQISSHSLTKTEIMLSGETVSPNRILLHYMKALTKSDKLRAFIAPKMTDLITFLDKNIRYAVYTGGNIHLIYLYLEMVRSPTNLTTSGQLSHNFGPSSYINSYTAYLQTVISDLHTRQKIILKWCGRTGHKADVCIIRGPRFLPPSLWKKMDQFNTLHVEEPNEPTRECNIQPPAVYIKSQTSSPKIIPVISSKMGRLNHHYIGNDDV